MLLRILYLKHDLDIRIKCRLVNRLEVTFGFEMQSKHSGNQHGAIKFQDISDPAVVVGRSMPHRSPGSSSFQPFKQNRDARSRLAASRVKNMCSYLAHNISF